MFQTMIAAAASASSALRVAAGRIVVNFQNGQTLTAQQLNTIQQAKVDANGGTASGLSITGGQLDATTTIAGRAASLVLAALRPIVQMWGTASTDWAPIIQTAINATAALGGGVIRLPAGLYPCLTNLTISTDGVVLEGDGNATILELNAHTSNFLTISNCTRSGIRNLIISGNTSFTIPTSGVGPFMVVLGQGANSCFVDSCVLRFGYNGIDINQSNGECVISGHTTMNGMAGTCGIRFIGSASNNSYRAILDTITMGNAPSGVPSTQINGAGVVWAASTKYNVGDVVSVSDGGIWYCVTAGTSGSSGPSGIPGTGAGTYNGTTDDGSVAWKFNSGNLTWLLFDSYAYSLVVSKVACLWGAHGLRVQDSANGSASYPTWIFSYDLEIDHSLYDGIYADVGQGLYFVQTWVGSIYGSGMNFAKAVEELIVSTCRIAYGGNNGIFLANGTSNVTITGNQIGNNGQYTAIDGDTTASGIYIQQGVNNVTINANIVGAIGNPVGNNGQYYGLYLQQGTTTNYVIAMGNIFIGNRTAGIYNPGAGSSSSSNNVSSSNNMSSN